ncbi:MAG: hypothetical protein A3E19_02605 [Planctomycetes bacterium RIFCSPHIGHO2_12_FULL_52_36]|nr:MAG: hypothetical protein A3E19_02605 [Planctomycetes bacterium RIFCSPHIGHO2_12_FULL_52_36]
MEYLVAPLLNDFDCLGFTFQAQGLSVSLDKPLLCPPPQADRVRLYTSAGLPPLSSWATARLKGMP